jgi:glycosyltransferase involved in cell wall biosynthesis
MTLNLEYNYSVIIPHKNSPILLQRCLDSIPRRHDIQIIIVDDNSNLSEVEFDRFPCINDSFVEVIFTKESKGAGYARNIGLKKATGKWLLFADADDFFHPDAFQQFDKYINSDFDIVYFSVTSVFSDNLCKEADRHIPYAKLVNEFVKQQKNAEDNLRYWHVSPCSKLIRRKLVVEKEIFFDEVPASNDLMFSVKTGHFATKIMADDFPAYVITVGHGSLTRTISSKNSRSRYCVYIRQYKFMEVIDRPDMRFKLMAEVIKSFRFGINEFWWYIKTAHKERVNIFLGMNRWPKVLVMYLLKFNKKDDYAKIIK